MNNCPDCPTCNSNYTVKSGKEQSRQRYRCNNCGRYFVYEPNLIDVVPTSSDSELDSKRKELGLSLLGISFGIITTAFLFLCLYFLFVRQLNITPQLELPNTEKRLD